MSRAFHVILTCTVLTAISCGKAEQQVTQQPEADTLSTQEAHDLSLASALRRPRLGDLDSMRARRTIRVLVPMNRTFFFYDGARERGFTVEYFRDFEQWLNRRFHTERTPTAVVFLPASREHFLSDLVQGRGDVAAGGVGVTERRARAVAFTEPLRTGGFHIVVTGPGAPPLRRLEDLAGREVYIRTSSVYAETIIEFNRRLAAEGLPPVRIRPANEDLEDEDILELVNAGVQPITIVARYLARFWSSALDSLRPREDLVLADQRELAYAVRKTSPQLRALLNEFLATRRVGTAYGNVMFNRYLVRNPWVLNPRATAERRRVTATIGFFRRHAQTYDLDYLLLMAQGYQESQLRQELHSPRGAVGVMQLLPRTADAPPISIHDVSTNAGNNIRAGAKYLRYLETTYFADSAFTPFNRQVFALAAYNAGPGRIAGLRRMAREEGLDPYVWFGNVEVLAGQEIGTETTTYVRNILKYYVTYQLTLDSTRSQ